MSETVTRAEIARTEAPPEATGASAPPAAAPAARSTRWWHAPENLVAAFALVVMAALPIAEIAGRRLIGHGVPGSVGYVQHLTLWVAFLGAMLASRERRHLALATTSFLPRGARAVTGLFASAVSCAVASVLARAAFEMVRLERASMLTLGGGIPIFVAEAIIPVGFAVIALRAWWQAGWPPDEGVQTRATALAAWSRRGAVIAVVAAVFLLGRLPDASAAALRWPLVAVIVAATVAGAPIFVTLGGLALVLFYADAGSLAAVPSETYRIVSSPTLPTIPLFTLAGCLLAEGKTPARLVRLFAAVAGWLPGGTAVAAVLVCAFFTTFTGASGVTILALGGLLLPVLVKDVYPERFSLGAVTASGSIGLLFPPSLPVILYGIAGRTPINEMFIGSLLPGCVLVGLVSAYCIRAGFRYGAGWHRPNPREVAAALWDAKWEVALPVVVFVSLFGGFATTVEAAALTALYALVVKCGVQREIRIRGHLPRVLLESAILVGGVLIILGCALGLTSYLIDAEIPARGAAWVRAGISSRWVFLLMLNGFLLIVGCLMDIFSAIFVVVPLLLPIAAAFDVSPLHLGVIFLVNLELGYLTPPVGMNLFLSSMRFRKPMFEVTRAAFPFLLVQLTGVLLVTYVPALSVGVVNWWNR